MTNRDPAVPRGARPLDLIVFGATSFVGRLLCEELLRLHGADGPLRWGIAGRSRARLEALRESLRAGSLPLYVADAADDDALGRLCAAARVVVSTVGPYALHGEPLVAACATSGTDYADLTGEVQWIRRMIERHAPAARASGARLVHACGFDSIPSDLGVLFLQRCARERLGEPCARVSMRVRTLRGGVSGGTVASLMNVLREAAADPALRRILVDPYALCPPESPEVAAARPRQPRTRGARFDAEWGSWVAPFVMSAVNVPVVLRSHVLLGHPWGGCFTYDEAVSTGPGTAGRLRALAMSASLAAFTAAGALAPTRIVLEKLVLPAPGEGPDERARREGRYELRFLGTTGDGRHLATRVTGDHDPGYGSTSRMLAQVASMLAEPLDEALRPGGSWTPASMFGERLIVRLEAEAGLRFEPHAEA